MSSQALVPPTKSVVPLARRANGTEDLASWHYAIIRLRADGTFGCPRPRTESTPGQLQLAAATPHDAQQRAWRWSESLREAMAETGQSEPAAAVPMRAVLRILAGSAGSAPEMSVPLHVVGTGELVLLATLALARGDADGAEAVLAPVAALPQAGPDTPLSHRLSVAFAQLGIARLRGDVEAGEGLVAQTRALLAALPLSQLDQVPGLSVMLDAHLGALEMSRGRSDSAIRALVRGADAAVDSTTGRAARADCLGQLALVEAFRGDLRRAARDAQLVLEGCADTAPAGAVHAHLANAWVHLERGEPVQARASLERVTGVAAGTHEPWLVTSLLVAEARLNALEGEPETAVRLVAAVTDPARRQGPDWLDELLAVASAEACLAAGEARRALAVLTPLPVHVPVEAAVTVGAALLEIGDLRGARAALAGAVAGGDRAPLGYQIRAWLLEAKVAHHEQETERVRFLVDRALRLASGEGMTRPLLSDASWLRATVERDVPLLRRHRTLVEALPRDTARLSGRPAGPTQAGGQLVESLTEREVQVLELLAQMFSTDEVASELFVSANTVKTHLKGIFRKLSVNRRVDAVRRGRELGLC
jgi:LuxR family maltose regulon positive regulatory protein